MCQRILTSLKIEMLTRQWMARFPNRRFGADLNVFDTWKLDYHAKANPAMDPLSPARIARWHDPTDAYLHAKHRFLWGGIDRVVTGKNPDGTLALKGGTQNNRDSQMHPLYRYIENVFEELDAPHEWFYDHKSDTPYYFPPAEVDLAKASFVSVSSRHRQLIALQGSQAKPVKWLEFRGITFRHTARTFMLTKEPLLRSDWTIYRGGTVLLTGTENCRIEDCDFDQVGGNAIFVNDYNRRLTIRGCLIADAGANGICFVGNPDAVRNALFNPNRLLKNDFLDKQSCEKPNNFEGRFFKTCHFQQPANQRLKPAELDRTSGPKSDDYPADCLVDNCLIYHTGRYEIIVDRD